MNILYDLTRLLARSLALSPRGIDRVDVRYAYYYLTQYATIFVYQQSGVFFTLDMAKAAQLIQGLMEKWQVSDSPAGRRVFHQTLYAETVGRDLAPWRKRGAGAYPYVDKQLQQQLQAVAGNLVYLNVSHQGISHYEAFVQLRALGVRRIVFYLHDTIPADYPEFVNATSHQRQLIQLAVMASCADTVLVNSDYTEQCFTKFANKYGLDLPCIHQLHIGLDAQFRVNDTTKQGVQLGNLPAPQKPYFIVVGAIEKRKNVDFLLPIWTRLAEMLPAERMPSLLLVGHQTPHGLALQKVVNDMPFICAHVQHLTTIRDDQLLALIQHAQALLFPSLVEGWGMPVVEALHLQVPVIASNIAAFKESSQGLAVLLDTDNPDRWFDEIHRMLIDKPYRQQWVEKVSAFKAPSWDAHFASIERCAEAWQHHAVNPHPPLSAQAIEVNILAVASIDKQALAKEMRAIKQSRWMKRLRKLLNKPQVFLKDSKFSVFRVIGRFFSA